MLVNGTAVEGHSLDQTNWHGTNALTLERSGLDAHCVAGSLCGVIT